MPDGSSQWSARSTPVLTMTDRRLSAFTPATAGMNQPNR